MDEHWESTEAHAHRAVADENRAAASNIALDPADPRWVLAVQAYSQLQGAALTYDRRQRVMRTARQLGVRSFDASVIIAIVQNHAREGRARGAAAGTLALLQPPQPVAQSWARWAAAFATAAVTTGFLIWWLTG